MCMTLSISTAALGALVAVGTHGATITAGDLRYTVAPPPTLATGWGPASDLEASALAADQLYQDWWWLRVGSENRESALSGAGGFTQPDAATLRFSAVHAGLSAVATWTVISTAAGEGELRSTLRISNPGSAPVVVRAFHYADIDVNGTYEDDTMTVLSPTLVRFADADGTSGANPYTVHYGASAGAHFGLGQNGSLIAGLTDGGKTNLTGALGDYAGGSNDLAGGWQWTFTLGANETVEIGAFVALVPSPGGAAALGAAGLCVLALGRRRRVI